MASSDHNVNVSQHILPAASNLLGICFLIFSYVRFGNRSETTLVDELIIVPIFFFLAASLLSYFSLRSSNGLSGVLRRERIADVFFVIGLVCLFAISVGIVLELFK